MMSTQSEAITSDRAQIWDVNLTTLLMAIVLGSSLMQFSGLLYPPKVISLNFWAIAVVYYSAFAAWLGMRQAMTHRIHRDTFMGRTVIILQAMAIVTHAGLLFFASQATDSLINYMWGWPVLYGFWLVGVTCRKHDLHLPEPNKPLAVSFSVGIVIATFYSVWKQSFPPVPEVANWIFVFAAFVNVAALRMYIRWQHMWLPDYDKKRVKK
jgi:hypothetical protein